MKMNSILITLCALTLVITSNLSIGQSSFGEQDLETIRDRLDDRFNGKLKEYKDETEGQPPVELIWQVNTNSNGGSSYIGEAVYDLLGNVVVSGPGTGAQVFDVNPNTMVTQLPLEVVYPSVGLINEQTKVVETDIDNNVFVATTGQGPGGFSDQRLVIRKFPPEGSFPLWTTTIADTQSVSKISALPSGDLVVVGRASEGPFFGPPFMLSLDPFFGGVAWRVDFPGFLTFNNAGGSFGIGKNSFSTDGLGNAYIIVLEENSRLMLYKVDMADGSFVWDAPIDLYEGEEYETYSNVFSDIIVDKQDNVIVASSLVFIGAMDTAPIRVTKLDGEGQVQWTHNQRTSLEGRVVLSLRDMALDLEGNAYVLFNSGISNGIFRVNSTGSAGDDLPEWIYNPPLDFFTGSREGIITTSVCPGLYFFVPDINRGQLGRLNEETGELEWEIYTNQGSVSPQSLLVNGGGSVITTSVDSFPGDSYIRKYRQPSSADETYALASPELQLIDESVWAPGVGLVSAETDFADEGFNQNLNLGGFFTIPFLGRFGGGLFNNVFFNFTLGAKAEASGGTLDIHLPMDVRWSIPPQDSLFANQIATISNTYSFNEAANLKTCSTPNVNAGITGSMSGGLVSNVELEVFSRSLLDQNLLDENFVVAKDYIPFLNLQDLVKGTFGGENEDGWVTTSVLGLVEIDFRQPKFSAQAPLINGGFDTGFDFEDFARARSSLTNAFMWLLGYRGITNPLDNSFGFNIGDLSGRLDYAALQLIFNLNSRMGQQIQGSNIIPRVRYEVYDENDGSGDDLIGIYDLRLDEQLNFPLPSDATAVVVPHVYATMELSNLTRYGLTPSLVLELLRTDISVSWKGFTLISEDGCLACTSVDLVDLVDIPIFANTWQLTFPEIEVTEFNVTGDMSGAPVLIGSSRNKLEMIIYDQTSPTIGSFNVSANRVSKMLLYGKDFSPAGNDSSTRAFISHQGRQEELNLTVINNATALVEVPNRFRLLPGVARIYLSTDLGTTRTIDLPIEYPRPLLDTVNPNIWAADPDFETIPLQVIDKKNPIGTDTFIARRDYYIVMRDQLWSSLTANGMSAEAYFPAFDFDALPALPTVLFNGSPLPRFVQPIENGILNNRLATYNYDRPQLVDVELCVPGPGGGISQTRTLNIAAPVPVASTVTPPEVEPGGELMPGETGFDIVVRGPRHVPTWEGYEEPKSSNFNEDSVVYFDGIPLETRFAGSSALYAWVPEALVQDPRRVYVWVHTPANGTEYLERQVDGQGNLVSFGMVPSGGESAPIPFEIRFREPLIEETNPSFAEQMSCVFDFRPFGVDPYNVTVRGQNFRDGVVVLINGDPRPTEFVSRNMLRMQMWPSDVDQLTFLNLSVVNPMSPNSESDRSPEYLFEVVVPTGKQDCTDTGEVITIPGVGP